MASPARRPALFAIGSFAVAACTYDFDSFIGDSGGGGGETGGVAAASGGAPGSGGTTPPGGTGGELSANAGESGEAAMNGGGAGGTGEAGADSVGGAAQAGEGGEPSSGGSSTGGSSASGGTQSGGTGGGAASATSTGGSGGSAFDCKAVSGTAWNGHCYFVTTSKAAWLTANQTCSDAAPSAHLVTIGDAEEEQMLESSFLGSGGEDRWIGLSLENTSTNPPATCKSRPQMCPFSWVTDEPLTFTKWGSHSATDREPNYTGACVRMQSDTLDWADLDCRDALTAICEVD